jgi:hypothetical protein
VKRGIGNFALLSGVGEVIDFPFRPDHAYTLAVCFNPHPRFWVPPPAANTLQFFSPFSRKKIIFHFDFAIWPRLISCRDNWQDWQRLL